MARVTSASGLQESWPCARLLSCIAGTWDIYSFNSSDLKCSRAGLEIGHEHYRTGLSSKQSRSYCGLEFSRVNGIYTCPSAESDSKQGVLGYPWFRHLLNVDLTLMITKFKDIGSLDDKGWFSKLVRPGEEIWVPQSNLGNTTVPSHGATSTE